MIGKTNTHEFAWGITTENPHFGRTGNPWDPARTPGGSSGGSGAAVAAGSADIALGTDTLGSIRIPAALNGDQRPAPGDRRAAGRRHLSARARARHGRPVRARSRDGAAGVRRSHARGARRHATPRQRVAARALPAARRRAGTASSRRSPPRSTQRRRAARATASRSTTCRGGTTRWPAPSRRSSSAPPRACTRRCSSRDRERYGEDVRARVAQALGVRRRAGTRSARRRRARARGVGRRDGRLRRRAGADRRQRSAVLAGAADVPRRDACRWPRPASAFGLPAAAVPIGFGPAGMPLGMQIIALDGDAASALELGCRYQRLTGWHRRRPALAGTGLSPMTSR